MLSPNLVENIEKPLYEQLYEYIKEEIRLTHLKSDQALPSKRNLSNHLDISINTITKAYEILIDEGYLYSVERKGYFVSNIDNLLSLEIDTKKSKINKKKKKKYKYNFKINNIDTDNFPKYTFRKLNSEIINDYEDTWLKSRDPQGLYILRNNIKEYLNQSRGVKTNTENIIISSGTEYLMQILLYILPKDSIFAVENPGYRVLNAIFEINNVGYTPISIDKNGMNYKELKNSPANIVLVTPSHQFPTGEIMQINRRIKLLNWADKNKKNYIIEDDYDSEFKYYGKPIPALKSLDRQDNVIYIGNFSKAISPLLRVSYMVLPDELLKIYYDRVPFMNCPVASHVQLSLAKFMEEGYFERHLNRMRNIYKEKRKVAIDVFKKHKEFKIIDSKAGLHFIIELNTDLSEEELVGIASENDIYIEGLSKYYVNGIKNYEKPKIIIGFGNMKNEDIEYALNILIKSLEKYIKKETH